MSVFIVPERGDIRVPSEFDDKQYHGESMELTHANVMVVGSKDADLSEMKKQVSEKIQFSI